MLPTLHEALAQERRQAHDGASAAPRSRVLATLIRTATDASAHPGLALADLMRATRPAARPVRTPVGCLR